jgi:hypothetical protein
MRHLLVCIVVSWSAVAIVRGSVGVSDLEVLRWEKTAPREIRLEVIEAGDHTRKIVHVRYGPHRVGHCREHKHLRPAAEADYDRAFKLLCQQLSHPDATGIRSKWCFVPPDLDTDSPN